MSMSIAVQLYTLRNEMEKDFLGTLERVAEIGYKGVEFAGYGGLKALKLKSELDGLGLKAAGSHVSIERLMNNLEEEVEFNLEIGNRYIVCPCDKFETIEQVSEKSLHFNRIGEYCLKRGLQFCYHNHSHEFIKIGDKYALDLLFENTDPMLVKAEIDTYWVQFAGLDPAQYIKKYHGRCPVIHQKDMDSTSERGFTEVGNGIMDIKSIFTASRDIGTEWVIVEQDVCKGSAIVSVKTSFDNLLKII